MKLPSEDWRLECVPTGRDGFIFYHEGSQAIPLYWEYGGGDVVVIVRMLDPDKFGLKYPWAVGREREIFERIAQEVIQQQAPTCRAKIDEKSFCIIFKEKAGTA